MKWQAKQYQRRLILKAMAMAPLVVAGGSLIYRVAKAAVKIPANYYLATLSDALPKGLQYTDDAAKSNPSARQDKSATCANCAQYAKSSPEFVHPKDGKVGPCEAFPKDSYKMHVKGSGWCLAYAKKT